jgi:hypothetical protein
MVEKRSMIGTMMSHVRTAIASANHRAVSTTSRRNDLIRGFCFTCAIDAARSLTRATSLAQSAEHVLSR